MLVPMADLINHYSYETCTTEVCHVSLELEANKSVREKQEYRKLRGNYDMSLLIPKIYFDSGDRKSNPLHFVEAIRGKIYDYQRYTEVEEQELAFKTADELMADHEEIDIWDIPCWTPTFEEDNDTSESEKEEEIDSEEDLFEQITNLKQKIVSRPDPKQDLPPEKKLTEDENRKIEKKSQEMREKVMNFVPGLTQKPSDLDKFQKQDLKSDIVKVDLLDQSESHSELQVDYPWFSTKDENVAWLDHRFTSL
jgi:hypothetical protein